MSKYWQSDYNYFHYIFVFTRHKRQAFWTRKHLFRVKQVYPMICWKKMLKLYLFSIYIVYFLSLIIDCNSSNMFILLAKPQRKQKFPNTVQNPPSRVITLTQPYIDWIKGFGTAIAIKYWDAQTNPACCKFNGIPVLVFNFINRFKCFQTKRMITMKRLNWVGGQI